MPISPQPGPRRRKRGRRPTYAHTNSTPTVPTAPFCDTRPLSRRNKHEDGINPSSSNYPRPYSYRPAAAAARPPGSRESSRIRFPDRQTGALSSTTGAPTTSATTSTTKTASGSGSSSSGSGGKSLRGNKSSSCSSSTGSGSRPYGYPKPLGHGNGFPVVSVTRYMRSQSTSFHIVPGPARRYRTYDVHDKHHAPCFRVVPTPLCLRETKTLFDLRRASRTASTGSPVLKSHQLVFSTRGRVFIHDLKGKSLLYLQKVNIVNFPKIIHGFVRPDNNSNNKNNKCVISGKPHLIISQEKEDGRLYVMRDRRSNEVACLERYRVTPRNERKRKYAYKLYVSAGYDYSLFIMCSVLLLDLWNR